MIKKIKSKFSTKTKNNIRNLPHLLSNFRKPKIFCISFQRTGTTSTGQFFRDHNYRVAIYKVSKNNQWTLAWMEGDYESIFKSFAFKSHQVYEDDPWWCSDFYKVLFHRFPKAKFILLERDKHKWFNSMINHSNGKTLGNTFIHSSIYKRQKEFYDLRLGDDQIYNYKANNLLPLNESHREHYENIYTLRNYEVKEFFEKFGPERLFNGQLNDQTVWEKMGKFFNIKVTDDYNVHANKTSEKKPQ